MPQALPLVAMVFTAGIETMPAWASALIVGGASVLSGLLQQPSAKSGGARQAQGIKTNSRSTQAPLPAVYGTALVGGNDVFIEATGTDNKDLWIVQTLAEGECDSIAQVDGVDQVFLDDKLPSEYGGNVSYWFHSGSNSQTVDTNLNTAVPAWSDTLRNTCYIVWKLTFDRDYFNSVPTRTVLLKGKKLYDFRDESTAWEENPVLAEYDYKTNARYGMGKDAAMIDTTSWTAAANYCDTKGWAINTALTGGNASDILDSVNKLFRGQLVWYDAKFYLRYADLNYESSVKTITDAHIVQEDDGRAALSISQPGKFGKVDGLRAKFVNPDKNHTVDDVPIGDTLGVISDFDLLMSNDRQHTSDIGTYNLERQQLDRAISGMFRDDCIELEPHDVITLNCSAFSISSQLMRVVQADIVNSGLIGLTLMYEATTLYNDDYDLDVEGTYTCNLPDKDATVPAVANAAIAEALSAHRLQSATELQITFGAPADYPWYSHVEVWISTDSEVTYTHEFDTDNDFTLYPVKEGTTYYVRLKTVSIFGQKTSDGNDQKLSKTVVGLASAPTSLADLQAVVNANTINLYSAKVSDTDIELYEFRLGSSWSGAIFLGAYRSPNLSLSGVKPGNHTFYCNTLRNNGEYGDTPRSDSASLIDPPDGWTVQNTETCDYQPFNTWQYTASANGWVGGDTTVTENANSVTLTSNGTDPRWYKESLSIAGVSNPFIMVRIKRISGSGWQGTCYYSTSGHGYSESYKKSFSEPDSFAEYQIITLDMSDLTAGGNDWVANTITGIRLDFGVNSGSDVFEVDWICTGGGHANTEHTTYDSDDYLICSHTGSVYTGTYKSPIYDRGASARYMVYVLCDILVIGAGTTWDDVIPSPVTWDQINASTKTWNEIFELPAAPSVSITLKYGDTNPPTNTVEKQEILSAIVTGRYFQVEITITDPSSEINALVENFTLKFCQ